MDLNLDAGESPEALRDGREAALYKLVTSVNIACGGHAGDKWSMTEAVRLAKANGLRTGAHPSYPDREGFGRAALTITPEELSVSIQHQLLDLLAVCQAEGVQLTHVKPHGALYNTVAGDQAVAAAFLRAIKKVYPQLKVMGLAGSPFLEECRRAGFSPLAEAFCDRRYEDDGTLRARHHADALIREPQQAAEQAVRIAQKTKTVSVSSREISVRAETMCIHGDTPGALDTAQAVRQALLTAGVQVQPYPLD